MLDANENMSKNDLPLKEWIDNNTNPSNRKQFLDNHLIPNVDLTIDNFKDLYYYQSILLKVNHFLTYFHLHQAFVNCKYHYKY